MRATGTQALGHTHDIDARAGWTSLGPAEGGVSERNTMRIQTLVGAAVLTVAASVLTACGGGGGSSASGDYCDELKSDAAFFNDLDSSNPDLSRMDEIFSRMHTLADDAPDEVADDWQTLDDAVSTIESALKDAGLKASDLGDLQSGQVPQGVDPSKLQALLPKLQALSSGDVSAAAQRIASNAKDKCDVDLGSPS
jgi:hypothetical protein